MKDHPALTPRAVLEEMKRRSVENKSEWYDLSNEYGAGFSAGTIAGIQASIEALDKIPESSTPPLLLEEFEKWLENDPCYEGTRDQFVTQTIIKWFKKSREDSTKS